MILADSSVWIAALRGESSTAVDAFNKATRDRNLIVGDLIVLEVLQGARSDAHAALLERTLHRHPVLPLLAGGLQSKAAANYRVLRVRGITIRKIVDLIVATYCIEHDFILLQQDRDFLPFARHLGLRTV